MASFIFPAPEPKTPKTTVHPVFLSFQGCRSRCVFCAQTLQSGQGERSVRAALETADTELRNACTPRELAFYGGTFTALPEEEQFACLELAAQYKKTGLITKVRASTRPDAVSLGLLARLADAGLDMLELGVQSFDDTALAVSSRGYDGETAARGCAAVKESGLTLGVQLMPGMPGMTEEAFGRDVAVALSFSPATLRLYPCLVLAGTRLAGMHGEGNFTPWALERTIPLLAEAQLQAWEAGTRVIRIGLAPQSELDTGGIMAGPRHPALGSMVRGLALLQYIVRNTALLQRPLEKLAVPRRFQGEFWGHRGSLAQQYGVIGLLRKNVLWSDEGFFEAWGG